jgi:hypothetical protein
MAKPFVTVETPDKIRRLRFGMNQLALLEDLIKRPVSQISAQNMGMKELRAAFFAGLSWDEPGLTLEQAGDLIDDLGLNIASVKVGEALELAFGPGKTMEADGPNGAAPGSGIGI